MAQYPDSCPYGRVLATTLSEGLITVERPLIAYFIKTRIRE